MESPEDIEPVRIGDRIANKYTIEARLGAGGMGIVYLAHDSETDRKVVVKFPKKHLVFAEGFRGRFQRERQQLIAFEHSSVVRVYGVGEHGGMPYMVLAYMSGGSLADRLAKAGLQSVEEVLNWLPRIAAALDSLHRQGIIHRDVKAANILFDSHDEAYLSDFGIIKIVSELEQTGTLTGGAIGSPESLAPEFIEGAYTPAYDQYGLATAVYQALAGKLPFEGSTGFRFQERLVREAPPKLLDAAPQAGRAISDVVMRGLAKDRNSRFASCREFDQTFSDAVRKGGSHPPPLPPPTLPPPPPPEFTGGEIPRILWFVLVVVFAVALFVFGNELLARKTSFVAAAQIPVVKVENVAASSDAEEDSAAALYERHCASCHAAGTGGAPKTGDVAAWAPRLAQDEAALFVHARDGFVGHNGVMPARGGQGGISDGDLLAAVKFMADSAIDRTREHWREKLAPGETAEAREEAAWAVAKAANSAEAFSEFAFVFPESARTPEAKSLSEIRNVESVARVATSLIGKWTTTEPCRYSIEFKNGDPIPPTTYTLEIESSNGVPKAFATIERAPRGDNAGHSTLRLPLNLFAATTGFEIRAEYGTYSEERFFGAVLVPSSANGEMIAKSVSAAPSPCLSFPNFDDWIFHRQ